MKYENYFLYIHLLLRPIGVFLQHTLQTGMWHVIMDSNVYSYGTCFWICKRNMSRTINLNKSLIGFIVTLISHDKSNYFPNVIILLWAVYSIHWSTYFYCIPYKIYQCIQRYLRYMILSSNKTIANFLYIYNIKLNIA